MILAKVQIIKMFWVEQECSCLFTGFMCLAYLLQICHWFIFLLSFYFSDYLECFVMPVFFSFLFALSACLHWTSEYLAWKQLSLARSPASPVFPTFWGHNTPVINSVIACFVSIFACSHLNMLWNMVWRSSFSLSLILVDDHIYAFGTWKLA